MPKQPQLEINIAGGLQEGELYIFQNSTMHRLEKGPDTIQQEPSIEITRPNREIFSQQNDSTTEHLLKGAPQPVFYFDPAVHPQIVKDGKIQPCICNNFDEPHKPHEGIDYPREGGIYVYLKDMLYPTKGFPFPEACYANNIIKRFFIGYIRFMAKNPLSLLGLLTHRGRTSWLEEFSSCADITLGQYRPEDKRFQKAAKALMQMTRVFLEKIGIREDVATSFARNVATMFEYDNAYMFRLLDLMAETNAERLTEDPAREVSRLFEILQQRDARESMRIRAGSMVKLLRIAFMIPKLKRAFIAAISSIKFSDIQADEADRYHMLRWDTYNFGGRTFEDRAAEFMRLHKGVAPPSIILEA